MELKEIVKYFEEHPGLEEKIFRRTLRTFLACKKSPGLPFDDNRAARVHLTDATYGGAKYLQMFSYRLFDTYYVNVCVTHRSLFIIHCDDVLFSIKRKDVKGV